MSSRTLRLAMTLGVAVAAAAVSLAANSAIAQGPPGAYYRQDLRGYYDHAGPGAIRGPGYIFVPGRGIIDAPCGLPTSACSNSENGSD
jgi:hypothetical protein